MNRHDLLVKWLCKTYNNSTTIRLEPLTSDASFRKYYRFIINSHSYLAVDAPPATEKNAEYFHTQKILINNNIKVPDIYSHDIENGFFVIEDFGSTLLLTELNKYNLEDNNEYLKIDDLYKNSLKQLSKIQAIDKTVENRFDYQFPKYDGNLLNFEMNLFKQWFLQEHLQYSYSRFENKILDKIFTILTNNAHAQPQVLVHRDFQSRNLMVLKDNSIGVIDFQDALWGPLTYDLVSLLKDCYIDWNDKQVEAWLDDYIAEIKRLNIISSDLSFDTIWYWFLGMTMQRHLKNLGIFARLYHRDKKDNYLQYLPRTLNYVYSTNKQLINHRISKELGYTKYFSGFDDFLAKILLNNRHLVFNKTDLAC